LVPFSQFPGTFPNLLVDLGLLALGLAVYGGVFAFVGAFFKRPLVIGLVFVFGWEQVVMLLPGYLKQFTIAYYLQALVPHAMPSDGVASMLQGLFKENPPAMVCLFWLFCVFGRFFVSGHPGGRKKGIRSRAIGLFAPEITDLGNLGPPGTVNWLRETACRTRRPVISWQFPGAILAIGLGTGLVASYMGLPVSVFSSAAGPEELQYVPADAAVVAYANVREVMNSQFRQRFKSLEPSQDSKNQFEEKTGLNLEEDVDSVVAAIMPKEGMANNPAGSFLILCARSL
jgi:hypothetical protein